MYFTYLVFIYKLFDDKFNNNQTFCFQSMWLFVLRVAVVTTPLTPGTLPSIPVSAFISNCFTIFGDVFEIVLNI